MLHTIDQTASSTSDAVIRAMFAARKSVFVDLLKWDVPVLEGRLEVDQFDDEHAVYLVLTDRAGEHLGSARLLPTCRPYILGSLYASLCEDQPPSDPSIFEITRFCLDRSLAARDRRLVRDALVAALADYALDNGIQGYCALAEMGWYQQILAFGWRCRPLGLPAEFQGRMLAAMKIEIDRETPALLISGGIQSHSPMPDLQRRAA